MNNDVEVVPSVGIWQLNELIERGVPVQMIDAEFARIGPLKVKILSMEEAEEAAIVVCANERFSAEALDGRCVDCDRPITFMPDSPKKPDKICAGCAIIRMKGIVNHG